MGYQALLFCPDEKTARTVTQVLSELDFAVEACIEPFAAVKKLMGQHFDAVVVDCDNEQNATLLFKSARNSTSNQASLAVAVVEGQAGVAKAFRIGANLVLTKPINIEQAKGTLRVARGLLRKGDPAKPAAATTTAAMPVPTGPVPTTPVPAAAPAKPVAAKAVPPVKAAAPAPTAALPTPSPVTPLAPKAAPGYAWPATAKANSPAESDDDLLEIFDDSIASPAPGKAIDSAFDTLANLDSPPTKLPASAAASSAPQGFKAGSPVAHGGGAASAPAPAREVQNSPVVEKPAQKPEEDEPLFARSPAAAHSEFSSHVGSAPSFTFGGANAPAEASGGSKKVFIGIAAAAIVAGALYFGWTTFSGHANSPASTTAPAVIAPASTPAPTPQIAKPSGSAKPAPTVPVTLSASLPPSQIDSAKNRNADSGKSDDSLLLTSAKPINSAASAPGKADAEPEPAAAPLVVKAGTNPSRQSKAAAVDAPAPSMTGMATTGAGALPDLGSAEINAPQPVLQTLSVSQGVSQGLLVKKVQPFYPKNALFMHVEGAVELLATISKKGDISHVKVLSGDSQLTRAATDAVKQWKYKPYLLNGEPVEIQTEITINFKLPK
jgi:protein TonB